MTTYTTTNFKTKKAFKEAVANKVQVRVYNPGPMGTIDPNGTVYISGPHFPAPHTWYAEAKLEDGIVVKVK